MKRLTLGVLLALVGLVATACGGREVALAGDVGDDMKDPVLELQAIYQVENPQVTIDYLFAGSGVLEETIRLLGQCDLYMPGAEKKYIDDLAGPGRGRGVG